MLVFSRDGSYYGICFCHPLVDIKPTCQLDIRRLISICRNWIFYTENVKGRSFWVDIIALISICWCVKVKVKYLAWQSELRGLMSSFHVCYKIDKLMKEAGFLNSVDHGVVWSTGVRSQEKHGYVSWPPWYDWSFFDNGLKSQSKFKIIL